MFAKAPSEGFDSRLSRYDHFIVHCSASPPGRDLDAEAIDLIHRNRTPPFRMNGYQAVITVSGEWQDADSDFKCRPIGEQGAHVGDCGRGWNSRSFGVCLVGGIDIYGRPKFNYTEEQMATLEIGIRAFLRNHPEPESVTILGHRDLIHKTGASPKACPCFDVRSWCEELAMDPKAGASAGISALPVEQDEDRHPNGLIEVPEHHMIQEGDTLSAISALYGVPMTRIRTLNGRRPEQDDLIHVGRKLILR